VAANHDVASGHHAQQESDSSCFAGPSRAVASDQREVAVTPRPSCSVTLNVAGRSGDTRHQWAVLARKVKGERIECHRNVAAPDLCSMEGCGHAGGVVQQQEQGDP